MKKIIVPAIGSRGDVQPYIALCQGLQRAGHQAILATNPTLCPLAESYGVTAVAVGPAVDMGAEGERLWQKSGSNLWLGLIRVMQLASRLVEQAYPDILELCRDADLVIVTDPTAGAAEAERLGVPWISATLQPGRIPVPPPPMGVLKSAFNKLTWGVVSRMMTLPINRFRKRVGAPLVKDIGSMMSGHMILLPVSPNFIPRDPRWPAHIQMTGYWYAQAPGIWSPPHDLVAFLEKGSRPVAISLGVMSTSGEQARESVRIVLAAIQQAGVRAIVQGWDQALVSDNLGETVYRAGSMPHTWLFDQVAAVVHHGGFGTTASALTAGVPAVVVPHIIDQYYWGQQVALRGVGPDFIPRAKLSVEGLAAAIRRATEDTTMRRKAAELGQAIRSEPDGLTRAVTLIEQKFF